MSFAELNIIATIKPLYSLVKNVSGRENNVTLLVRSNASPHHYQLRPSDIKKLKNADVIFLIDDTFEVFLSRYLANQKLKAKIVKLSETKGLKILKIRKNQDLLTGTTGHCNCSSHKDIHFWSDIDNAKRIVLKIAETLSDLDPKHKKYYEDNAYSTVYKLDDLDREMTLKVSLINNKNFIVFHDAYQYLERKYGLSNVGTIAVRNKMNYGAKTISQIQKIIKDKYVKCIFAEHQFSGDVVRNIAENAKIKYNYLDIEWGESYITAKPEEYYFIMMRNNAKNLVECLS